MKKTSIHFEPCNVLKSEKHNKREQELDYIFPELSHKNESFILCDNLAERKKNIAKKYTEKVGRKMPSTTVPIREAVVVIDESTTMEDLKILANEIQLLLGWQMLQIHIHRDEGYVKSGDNKGGEEVAKLNLHAHLVFDCQNKESGKMHKITKQQLREMQTITALTLNMERGNSSNRKHLKSLDWKIKQKEKHLSNLNNQLDELEVLGKEMEESLKKLSKIEELELFEAKEEIAKMERRRKGRRI